MSAPAKLTPTSALRDSIRGRSGMIIGQARIETISHRDHYTWVSVRLDQRTHYPDRRPGDAFKVHLPTDPGHPVTPPTYDPTGTAIWPPDSQRVVTRCLTAIATASTPDLLTFAILTTPNRPAGFLHTWLSTAAVGDVVAVTGVRTEWAPTPKHRSLLIGDATALPAMSDIAAASKSAQILLITDSSDLADLTADHPSSGPRPRVQTVTPQRVLQAVQDASSGRLNPEVPPAGVWIGGEQDLVKSVRRHLLDCGEVPDTHIVARSYWQHGHTWQHLFDEALQRFYTGQRRGLDLTNPKDVQHLEFDAPSLNPEI